MVPFDGFRPGAGLRTIEETASLFLAQQPKLAKKENIFLNEDIQGRELLIKRNNERRLEILHSSGLSEKDLTDIDHVLAAHKKVFEAQQAVYNEEKNLRDIEKRLREKRQPPLHPGEYENLKHLEEMLVTAQWEFQAQPQYAEKFELYRLEYDNKIFTKQLAAMQDQARVRAALDVPLDFAA